MKYLLICILLLILTGFTKTPATVKNFSAEISIEGTSLDVEAKRLEFEFENKNGVEVFTAEDITITIDGKKINISYLVIAAHIQDQ